MSQHTITLEIEGMHCASCSLLVDDCMEDVDGVVSSRTSLKTKQCVAVVDESVPVEALLAAVAEAGYTAKIL
jgi:copper chaperone CopZ